MPEWPVRPAIANVDEIELIIDYLNGHLDPERLEAVRKRLEEDAAHRRSSMPRDVLCCTSNLTSDGDCMVRDAILCACHWILRSARMSVNAARGYAA